MQHLVSGLFFDSEAAGEAVSHLKNKGFTKEISVISQDWNDLNPKAKDVKKDVASGAAVGAGAGAAVAAAASGLAAAMMGAMTLPIPGMGLVVAGPLTAALGGAAAGAATGGILGALITAGMPEEKAKIYEQQIEAGDTMVSVTVDDTHNDEVRMLLEEHGAGNVEDLILR